MKTPDPPATAPEPEQPQGPIGSRNQLGSRAFRTILVGCVAIFALGWIQKSFSAYLPEYEDSYFAYVEGTRLLNGENPYARILEGNMRENDKYATYLPGFYLLSALTQAAGLDTFPEWVRFWRWVFLLAHLGAGWLCFRLLIERGSLNLAILGSGLYLFNRWSLYVLLVAQIEPLAILCLLASLMVLRRRPLLACLLLGISLSIKQIAVFLVPLYLLYVWMHSTRERRWRATATAFVAITALPVLLSIPFLVWNAKGYVLSLLFSATRAPGWHGYSVAVGEALRLTGVGARVPMLALMGLVLWGYFRKRLPLGTSAFLIMLVFVDFNSVLFSQYLMWTSALLPFLLADVIDVLSKKSKATRLT